MINYRDLFTATFTVIVVGGVTLAIPNYDWVYLGYIVSGVVIGNIVGDISRYWMRKNKR